MKMRAYGGLSRNGAALYVCAICEVLQSLAAASLQAAVFPHDRGVDLIEPRRRTMRSRAADAMNGVPTGNQSKTVTVKVVL